MGETTCLMQQPFSYTAGIPNDADEGNPVHALGQSVSFGRFMTESLSWEKWSSFSNNRYVEEAERYSRPGSVAEKKAFFEAHYKSIAARKAAAAAAAAAEAKKVAEAEHEVSEVVSTNCDKVAVVPDEEVLHVAEITNNGGVEFVTKPLSEAQLVVENCVEVEFLNNIGFVADKKEVREVELSGTQSCVKVESLGQIGFIDDKNKVREMEFSGTQNCVKVESLGQIGFIDDKNEVREMELGGTQSCVKVESLGQIGYIDDKNEVRELGGTQNCVKIESVNQIGFVDDEKEVRELELGGTQNCVMVKPLIQIRVDDDKEEVSEMELSGTKQMEKPLLKDFMSEKDDSARVSKKKPSSSCSRSLIYGRGTKMPSSPAKPVPSLLRAKKDNNVTPISKNPATDLADKRKSTPKSTHRKSMSFTPVREFNRITSSIMKKIDNSRVGSHSKPSKDCPTPLRTPLKTSILGERKHPLATPQSENRRAVTPINNPLASGSKTVRPKWNFLPTDCSKFMSGCRNKSQSPSLSAPFSFRTEERAARRKKLEEKFNADQAQKVQMQSTLKENTETEIKKLRQNLCFKARPLPEFYKERGEASASKKVMAKVQMRRAESPNPSRTPTPSRVQCISQLPKKFSMKKISETKQVTGGDKSETPNSLRSRLKAARENTSPNIQHCWRRMNA